MSVWFADQAWLGGDGLAAGVVLEEAGGGRLARVAAGQDPPAGAVHLAGIVVPGLANVHSHAFHRTLRGRAQAGEGDFWRWRDRMYALAAVLDPDDVFELARGAYVEMALAGITAVGEFHYLHHRPDGRPYADANVMGGALIAAAAEAGVRLTLLDTCYLRSGFGESRPAGPQVRFSDGDAGSWVARVDDLASQVGSGWRLGAAVHSVRAVDERSMAVVAGWAQRRGSPLHMHVSEQPAENDEALAATGRTPTALAEAAGMLGPGTVAVHATHLTDPDVKALGATGTGVCLCPTTERDLGDGVGPAGRLVAAGSPLSLGSDSHAVIDLLEEARLVELHERLADHRRGGHSPAALLGAATAAGYRALGWSREDGQPGPIGLAPGGPADFVVLDPGSVRLAGIDAAEGVAGVVFAATAADVTDVVVGGRMIVRGRSHVTIPDVARDMHRAIRSVWART